MLKNEINKTKKLLKISVIVTVAICVILGGLYIINYFSKADNAKATKQTVTTNQQANTQPQTMVIQPSSTPSNLPIFHCEAGATCYSSNKATSHTLSTTLEHLDPNTRFNYTLIIVSNGSINNIANKTQGDLIETCSREKLCIIRNDVQKGTILKDLKRIGEGYKNIFFKYSASNP